MNSLLALTVVLAFTIGVFVGVFAGVYVSAKAMFMPVKSMSILVVAHILGRDVEEEDEE